MWVNGVGQFEAVCGLVGVVRVGFEFAFDNAPQYGEVVIVEVVIASAFFAAQQAFNALAQDVGVVFALAEMFGNFDVEASRIKF